MKRGEAGPAKADTPQFHALLEHNERLFGIVVASIVSQVTSPQSAGLMSHAEALVG